MFIDEIDQREEMPALVLNAFDKNRKVFGVTVVNGFAKQRLRIIREDNVCFPRFLGNGGGCRTALGSRIFVHSSRGRHRVTVFDSDWLNF
jgi:hypothetical protein